jgi:hypothetical protein
MSSPDVYKIQITHKEIRRTRSYLIHLGFCIYIFV